MLMQDELGTIARDLIEDLERARPGFPFDSAGFERAALAPAAPGYALMAGLVRSD